MGLNSAAAALSAAAEVQASRRGISSAGQRGAGANRKGDANKVSSSSATQPCQSHSEPSGAAMEDAAGPLSGPPHEGSQRLLWGEQQKSNRNDLGPTFVKGFGCRPMVTSAQGAGPASETLQGRNPRGTRSEGAALYGDLGIRDGSAGRRRGRVSSDRGGG